MQIYENERLDYVNDSLSLIQKTDGLTFGTDALLLGAYVCGKYKTGLELGGGSGIISMLLATRKKVGHVDCCEVQEEYATLIERNVSLNKLEALIRVINGDIRNLSGEDCYEIVFTNPPYMKKDCGKENDTEAKKIARHEIFGDIGDFCACAKRSLKYGGTFYAVYRPDRLCDIIDAMRKATLEPKRMTFVHADTDAEASMVLIEAKRGGKSGMHLTSPLIIYKDKSHKEYTEDMEYIMENGNFPPRYKR